MVAVGELELDVDDTLLVIDGELDEDDDKLDEATPDVDDELVAPEDEALVVGFSWDLEELELVDRPGLLLVDDGVGIVVWLLEDIVPALAAALLLAENGVEEEVLLLDEEDWMLNIIKLVDCAPA